VHAGGSSIPNISSVEFPVLSSRVSNLLTSFANARTYEGLGTEETAIFLAIGHLSLVCGSTMPALKPITYQAISDLLNIPKATVRRKAIRLVDKQLVFATARGVMIRDIDKWFAMAKDIFP
jgi:hypothetical protein